MGKKEKTKTKISTPKKEKKKGIFYYAMPWNLVSEINILGYVFTIQRILAIYILVAALGFVGGKLFKMPLSWCIGVVVPCILLAPTLIRNSYKNKYEFKRFSDVNVYIEQMLYAFKNSQKVLTALQDVQILFQAGPMKECIDQAIETITSPNRAVDGNENVERVALDIIERRYPNKYIKQLHRFMLKVEDLGGNFDSSIELLLKSRAMWENRTYRIQHVRSSKKLEVLVSCVASVALCAMMLYILPENVSIAENTLVRIGNIVTIASCFWIYVKADSKLATNLIEPKRIRTDEEVMKDYNKFVHYDKMKSLKNDIRFAIPCAVIGVVLFFITKNKLILVGALGLAVFMSTASMLGYNLLVKRMKQEVNEAFPQWLMELALLLQGDNVHVAILKTVDTALPILKPELRKFKREMDKMPNSPQPFLNFCYMFGIPEITTSMQMLYSLSAGTGGDANEQITNIVNRNNLILDRAEEESNNNSLASLNTLFLAPVLVGGVVLMLDMTVFLMQFMAVMGNTGV